MLQVNKNMLDKCCIVAYTSPRATIKHANFIKKTEEVTHMDATGRETREQDLEKAKLLIQQLSEPELTRLMDFLEGLVFRASAKTT